MANQAAKKRLIENAIIMRRLRMTLLVPNLIYVLFNLLFWYWGAEFGFGFWTGVVLIELVYGVCYLWIHGLAKPEYEDNGKLLSGGSDLTIGFCEYYFDAIYITIFVQITTLYSNWFWLAYLIIPAYALIKLWGLVKPFLFGGSSAPVAAEPEEESAMDKKRRRRREHKQKRYRQ
eukprot:TRINITY_DN19953_c0_g1_i1.p1 TRINITY_DN19953_c0_g1~~TRINITY_DN19953_c0_g1_i1.p1  ORF type:complete len:175 (-),score=29.48 TRINITY_DN19953_c0_g1_i1:98-622(-)